MSPIDHLNNRGEMTGTVGMVHSNLLRISLAVLALFGASLACTRRATSPAQQTNATPQVKATTQVKVTQPETAVPTLEPQIIPSPSPFIVFLPFFPVEQSSAEQPITPGEQSAPITVDPRVELVASATTLKVGEILTIKGVPVDIGLPYYYVVIRDDGVQDMTPMVMVTYENILKFQDGTSQVFEFVSAEGSNNQVIVELRAKAPGVTTVSIDATGEIHSSAGTTWSGGGSGSVVITVIP
jgi:hypothetical protein